MDTLAAIQSRRTVKLFNGTPLSREALESLIELACWAPTHRLTQPWRWYACDQSTVWALGDHLATSPAVSAVLDSRKATKARDLMRNVGGMVLVTYVRNADPVIDREDLAAAAAAVQTLLLAATAKGLGSFWSTNPGFAHESTLRWCGADPVNEGFVGAIWLGVTNEVPKAVPRVPLVERLHWVTIPT